VHVQLVNVATHKVGWSIFARKESKGRVEIARFEVRVKYQRIVGENPSKCIFVFATMIVKKKGGKNVCGLGEMNRMF